MEILASILGGLVGGLFTYLGVWLTIKNERKLREEDIKRQNQEKNKAVIEKRPEFKVVDNADKIKAEVEIYTLPYIKPKLVDHEEIIFDYDPYDFENDDSWDCVETIICNIGKTAIELSFLQTQYKQEINIYSPNQISSFKYEPIKHYYCDMRDLPDWIWPDEHIKIKLFYPKEFPELYGLGFNCYMHDENDNYWFQKLVDSKCNRSQSWAVSGNEFRMHYQNKCNRYYVFKSMYYSKVKKCFSLPNKSMKDLNERLVKLSYLEDECEKFKYKIKNGEVLLN